MMHGQTKIKFCLGIAVKIEGCGRWVCSMCWVIWYVGKYSNQ